ncbi:MAG: ABC transporter substrate-binding protein [Christensenellales bacterium]|jgi:peptide/nickel transport system substrate-binding protein
MKKLSTFLVIVLLAMMVAVPAVAEGGAFTQAPMLDGMELPPIEERLPVAEDVMVVEPGTIIYEENFSDYRIGKYGGTLKSVRNSATWDGWIWCILQERIIETVSGEGKDFYPNIVKAWEINDDYSEYTFFLRKGMKWSDGVPVTTADVAWAFEKDHANPLLTATWPTFLRTNNSASGTPCTLEIVDDYTFKIKFDGSYPGFLLRVTCQDYNYFFEPSHYLKDFHIDTADQAELAAKCEAEGFQLEDWYKLYELHDFSAWDCAAENQIGCPTLCAWMTTSVDGSTFTFTRNPYYFKVDTEGQQLPYCDYLTSTYCVDEESIAVKILANEVDYTYEWVPLPDMGLYANNPNYVMATKTLLHRTGADLYYSFTYNDANWREVVNQYDFRAALHYAINADEIIDTVYFGFARPAEELSIVEFNPEKAAELLDGIGMTVGADGWRTYPNGDPCEIELVYSSWMVTYEPTATLIADDLRNVGLNIKMKYVDNDLMDTLRAANDVQMSVSFSHGPVYIQSTTDYSPYGMACNYYLDWLYNGEKGEESPELFKEWWEILYSVTRVPYEEAAAQHDLQRAFCKEHLLMYAPCLEITQPSLVSKRLRNYPTEGGYNLDNCHASEVCWIEE